MAEYRFTFGQRYPRETHKMFPEANRDGYVTVVADDYFAAREIAVKHLDTEWAFQYEEPFNGQPFTGDLDPQSWEILYPLGELARWSE